MLAIGTDQFALLRLNSGIKTGFAQILLRLRHELLLLLLEILHVSVNEIIGWRRHSLRRSRAAL
jgi:hypothetical protein